MLQRHVERDADLAGRIHRDGEGGIIGAIDVGIAVGVEAADDQVAFLEQEDFLALSGGEAGVCAVRHVQRIGRRRHRIAVQRTIGAEVDGGVDGRARAGRILRRHVGIVTGKGNGAEQADDACVRCLVRVGLVARRFVDDDVIKLDVGEIGALVVGRTGLAEFEQIAAIAETADQIDRVGLHRAGRGNIVDQLAAEPHLQMRFARERRAGLECQQAGLASDQIDCLAKSRCRAGWHRGRP